MAKKNYCDVQYTHLIWTVKYPNFSLGCDTRSPSFSVDSFGNTKFCVRLFSEKEDEIYNYVSVYIEKHETYCGPKSISFVVKLSVTTDGRDDYFVEETICLSNQHVILLERCASLRKKKEYCGNALLTVRLEIEPTGSISNGSPQVEDDLSSCRQQELEMLSSDLNRALKAKRFSDLTFRSIEGTRSMSLHKCIVAARYPKLATHLVIEENSKRECNLGVDFDTISMLTQYLYSGSIDTGSATFGLHDILRRAELDHLERVLYPTPRIIHATTSVTSKYGSFVWIVPKFSSLEEGQMLVNTLCLEMRLEWTKLRVLMYIRQNAEDEECLAFKIVRTQQDGKMYMLCTISFVADENGQYSKSYEHVFRCTREWNIMCFAKRKFIEKKREDFLPGDTLKLRFEFVISDLIETSEYECVRCLEVKRGQYSVVAMNLWALQKDLKSLYLDPTYCDCTLQVRDELIPAHKVILSARSAAFSEMLDGDTPENESGRIVINAFDTCVIKSMLCYIYCGELPEVSKKCILNVYKAAQTYQVKQLAEKCSRIIGSLLDVSVVAKVLQIADLYNDEYLKEHVKNFVSGHADEVFDSYEWNALKRERIDLTASIMNAVLGSLE